MKCLFDYSGNVFNIFNEITVLNEGFGSSRYIGFLKHIRTDK